MKSSIVSVFTALSLFSGVAIADSQVLTPVQQDELKDRIHYCGWCHGETGAEAYALAPRLAGQQADYIVTQLTDFQQHKREEPNATIMWGAVSRLDQAMILALADYFSRQNVEAFTDIDVKKATTGKDLYMIGKPATNVVACQFCHGPDGHGNSMIPRLAGQRAAYVDWQLHYFKEGFRSYAAPMPDEAKGLSDDEIEAVAEYVSSLP